MTQSITIPYGKTSLTLSTGKLAQQAKTAPGKLLKAGTPEHRAALMAMGFDTDLMSN